MLKNTRDKKGWLLPYLLALDDMFFKRWNYWLETCISNTIPEQAIPYIPFKPAVSYPKREVFKNIIKCLDYERYTSSSLEHFVDWLLWGFNQGEHFPAISGKVDDFWYRTFNLGLFYSEPADHWPDIYLEVKGSKNSNGFFPTPATVVEMMVRMTMGDSPQHHHKHKSVLDPCCGTGVMLLYASNYSLNLYGQDISLLLTKIATINAFIYIPWMVYKPKHLTIFNKGIENIELPSGCVSRSVSVVTISSSIWMSSRRRFSKLKMA
ncbi:MAG: SAM-dependent DNA methyltransferase [Calditrichae bacterium]|nr:SAM-dependent DNA methyltransferase [Calditrichia bacterium]